MSKSFLDTPAIRRRNQLMERLIKSLAHYPRDHAMSLIMSWIPQDDLEAMAPTLSGQPNILEGLEEVPK